MKVKNNYDECLTNLACSIRKYFGLEYKHNTLSYIDKLLELDRFIQEQIIYKILEDIYHDDVMLVNDRHVELILELVNSNKKNSFIYLPIQINFTIHFPL